MNNYTSQTLMDFLGSKQWIFFTLDIGSIII